MQSEAFRGKLALRVDVDFPLGLSRAVPQFLDRLGAANMRATFFVVTGENRASPWRLLRRDYLRRLARLGPGRILAKLLLPSFGVSADFLGSDERRRVLRRIVDEGHELAVHGYDHAWWADHVWDAEEGPIAEQIERAYAALDPYNDGASLAWGSPNWRTTETALRHLEKRGVPYFADCWGWEPFRTLDREGNPFRPPHLPITLPTLESLILEHGCGPADAAERVLDGRPDDRFDLLCVHDYFEGLLHEKLFDRLVEALCSRGIRATTLLEAAHQIEREGSPLPARCLDRRPVPGFSGAVSWQGRNGSDSSWRPTERKATRPPSATG